MSLYSFAQIGKKGERKEDLTRAKFNDSRFIFTYEVNKLLLRAEVEYMFSGFRFRNRSADPTQAVGGKDQTKMIIPVMKRLSNSLKKWDDLN